MRSQNRTDFLLVPLAALSLLAALWAGLVRLGWSLPLLRQDLASNHGPLMIVGFLGTLISLERAAASERRWPHGASICSALAAVSLLAGLPSGATQILSILGSLFLFMIFAFLYRRHPSISVTAMGTAALLWLLANSLWYSGYPFNQVVPWWAGFLVLTIAGERLELSRVLRLPEWNRLKFLLANGIFLSGLLISVAAFDVGIWVCGFGLIALALWLLRYDMAWRTVRQAGLLRYMAVCLLIGYIWLGIGGVLWISFSGSFNAGPGYDAMLHSIFLGFVFSMVFAHAPIIFPSITGVAMPFDPAFYLHLGLLHLSLLLRVASSLALWRPGQAWGGLLNALAILLFLVNNVRAVRAGRARA